MVSVIMICKCIIRTMKISNRYKTTVRDKDEIEYEIIDKTKSFFLERFLRRV